MAVLTLVTLSSIYLRTPGSPFEDFLGGGMAPLGRGLPNQHMEEIGGSWFSPVHTYGNIGMWATSMDKPNEPLSVDRTVKVYVSTFHL